MAKICSVKAMNDVLGGTVEIGNWVIFAHGAWGGLSIGKVERFNEKSMIVQRRKGKPLRKTPMQVARISDEQVMLNMFIEG